MINRCLVIAVVALSQGLAFAQSNRQSEAVGRTPSRWQAEVDQLDAALRDRVLTGTQPRAQWIAGKLDVADPSAQVAHFAQARVDAPAERLYVASLASACMAVVRPLPRECEVPDRLADWATRDTENGVPSLLLADRARLRNDGAAMIAHLEEAALRPRFDDYSNRGALLWWDEVRALPVQVDPAARAEFTALALSSRVPPPEGTFPALCRDTLRFGESARAACVAAGAAMAQRANTWELRTSGAQLAQRSATTPDAQATAARALADLRARAYACAESGTPVTAAFGSADAAVRSRALAQWEARLRLEADVGEVAACGGVASRKG